MVLNKCSMERGLAHGEIYKTEIVDLSVMQIGSRKKYKLGEVCIEMIFITFNCS